MFVLGAYLSPTLVDEPTRCSVLAMFFHYFFLCQFTWMFIEVKHLSLMMNGYVSEGSIPTTVSVNVGLGVGGCAVAQIVTLIRYDVGNAKDLGRDSC